ncbi:MAG: sigma-70 family RNA polymerase sigma factor [Planctomycetes bacterium]|nr:sigma-70 family RNA polymerase sigma factor [Planctomycetota bacterium]
MADDPIEPRPEDGDLLRLYARFVQEHWQDVYTLVLRLVGNKEDASDLTQEALLQTYRTWSSVDPNSSGGYLKWCYRIARNLSIDFLRKKKPRGAEDEELERSVDQEALRPEEVYEHRVQAAQLREALMELPVMYREVLLLRYQSEMSYERIAEILDVPVTTVETRIHRAKRMLRRKLERDA